MSIEPNIIIPTNELPLYLTTKKTVILPVKPTRANYQETVWSFASLHVWGSQDMNGGVQVLATYGNPSGIKYRREALYNCTILTE